jgi:hypothetical protein
VTGAEEPGAHDGRQTDRTRSHHGDHVTRPYAPVEDPDLVARGQDVGQHEDLLVGGTRRDLVGGRVGEGDAHVLGLGAVGGVAEDPAAAAEALAVAAFPAEAARAARGDARHEHPVTGLDRLDGVADRLDRPDGFVAEDPPVGHRGDVAFEDVEIGAADRHGVDADDGVGVVDDRGLGHIFPSLLTRPVIHECLHT